MNLAHGEIKISFFGNSLWFLRFHLNIIQNLSYRTFKYKDLLMGEINFFFFFCQMTKSEEINFLTDELAAEAFKSLMLVFKHMK